MEDWQKNFFAVLETTAVEIEHFFRDVSEVIEDVAEEIGETIDTINEQLQETIKEDFDRHINDFFGSILDLDLSIDTEEMFFDGIIEEQDWPIASKLRPDLENHPACIGCHHYHGLIYGGNLLVCGMHPYGWDQENCPDWQEDRPRSL